MSGRNATQREVIERLSIVLQPARATVPAAPPRAAISDSANGSAQRLFPRRDARVGALQQRYRLYRVCGYGVVSALYYSAKSPTW